MRPDDVPGRPYDAPRARGLLNWFDARGRGLGMWAFALNRVTGIEPVEQAPRPGEARHRVSS